MNRYSKLTKSIHTGWKPHGLFSTFDNKKKMSSLFTSVIFSISPTNFSHYSPICFSNIAFHKMKIKEMNFTFAFNYLPLITLNTLVVTTFGRYIRYFLCIIGTHTSPCVTIFTLKIFLLIMQLWCTRTRNTNLTRIFRTQSRCITIGFITLHLRYDTQDLVRETESRIRQ